MAWKRTGQYVCMAIVDEEDGVELGGEFRCCKPATGFYLPPSDAAPWMLRMTTKNGKGVPGCETHLRGLLTDSERASAMPV